MAAGIAVAVAPKLVKPVLAGAAFLGLALGTALMGVTGAMSNSQPGPIEVEDIPEDFMAAYRTSAERFEFGADGWSYLAAIGKVESDHGRLQAPGVRSGQNNHGCCAGPMQIHNGYGSGGGTWAAYKTDGDGDGGTDIYQPADAVATAANYLRASGAPADWRRAIFAYNHADWYVDKVVAQAAVYRDAATANTPITGPNVPTTLVPATGDWLADVPGMPGERCDRRIVADVVMLIRAFGVRVTDCHGGAPHAIDGEHPLGLATDLVPSDGDWSRTMRLARAYGWEPSCASSGCDGRGPFRVVLYNGFPGHGDPSSTSSPHLHLSWAHAPATPFTRARWVRVLTPAPIAP
ncbi:hypothetical protein OJ998_04955 [Solirubrobacter taibaiensis]|nr:hypothetical protein [Solirubrobacter taibaiensis]